MAKSWKACARNTPTWCPISTCQLSNKSTTALPLCESFTVFLTSDSASKKYASRHVDVGAIANDSLRFVKRCTVGDRTRWLAELIAGQTFWPSCSCHIPYGMICAPTDRYQPCVYNTYTARSRLGALSSRICCGRFESLRLEPMITACAAPVFAFHRHFCQVCEGTIAIVAYTHVTVRESPINGHALTMSRMIVAVLL